MGAFRLSLAKHGHSSLEPKQEDSQIEETLSFQEQLTDLESKYTAAMTESSSLRVELAQVEECRQSLLMDVEEARKIVQETHQKMDSERMLLKEAQDEAR